jgi:hypothetical protein
VLVLPVAMLAVAPPVLNRVLAAVLRLSRRPPLPTPLSLAGILQVAGWSIAAWLCYGGQVYLLARQLGAEGGALLWLQCTGAFAAAFAAGLMLVLVPAGAGSARPPWSCCSARPSPPPGRQSSRSSRGCCSSSATSPGPPPPSSPSATLESAAGQPAGSAAQTVVHGNGLVTSLTSATWETKRTKPRLDQWLRCPGVLPRSRT